MSGKHHKRVEKSSSSSDSDREYVEKTTIKKVERMEKFDRKENSNSSKSSQSSNKSKSRSSSKSSSYKKYKNRKDKSRSKSCSSSSSSSEEHHKKYEFCDIYNYMKNRLVEDDQLMVYGSEAYTNETNTVSESIPVNHVITYNQNVIDYNIDYTSHGSPFFVRKSGVYICFFIVAVDTAAQFTVFINGVEQPYTCVGTNAGAGQIINRCMLKLKENDNVLIRNYITTSAVLNSNIYSGGSQVGNSATCLMMKIAPYCAATVDECEEKDFFHHLSHSKRKLFKQLQDKLVCDPELMMKGFNVTGTFSTKVSQVVNLESDVVFDTTSVVKGLGWNNSSPSQIVIQEDGVYKLFFSLTTNTAVQFALTVNGVAVESTTQGSNKGAGQLTSRALLSLKKNDVITVRNHSSLLGSVSISQNAGGLQPAISAILTVFKIANNCKPVRKEVPCHLAKKLNCLYDKFRTYLLYKDELQITGSPSYFSYVNSSLQTVNQNDPFYYATTVLNYCVRYRPGDATITIKEDGVYDLFADIATNEPLQITLFVNGVPNPTTIFGRDSGANRCIIRQFAELRCGDVISINNYLSASVNVTTVENSGGNFIGNNTVFMAFKLRNLCA